MMQHGTGTSQSREMETSKMPLHKKPGEAFCRAVHWNRGGFSTVPALHVSMRWLRGSAITKGRTRADRAPVIKV